MKNDLTMVVLVTENYLNYFSNLSCQRHTIKLDRLWREVVPVD